MIKSASMLMKYRGVSGAHLVKYSRHCRRTQFICRQTSNYRSATGCGLDETKEDEGALSSLSSSASSSTTEIWKGKESDHTTKIGHSVIISRTEAASLSTRAMFNKPSIRYHRASDDDTALVDALLARTSTLITRNGLNVVAYSGGVDSSLAAALVHRCLVRRGSHDGPSAEGGTARAVLGVSPALSEEQLRTARLVASEIGIELDEVSTGEGSDPMYIENAGEACYACKTHLYSALTAVGLHAANGRCDVDGIYEDAAKTILFNGTNADDVEDPTRIGLLAAKRFDVRSPLQLTSKKNVRRAARHLGLSNWDAAASPCLRSRLAFGVKATSRHLKAVEEAERRIRLCLKLDHTKNLRVRMLARNRAMIEVDPDVLTPTKDEHGYAPVGAEEILKVNGFQEVFINLGFKSYDIRAFRSGSVAALPKNQNKSKVGLNGMSRQNHAAAVTAL